MKKILLIFLLIPLIRCSQNKADDYKITIPKISSHFFKKGLSEVNSQLESNPDDSKLIDKKLYYCQQLNWPQTCEETLQKKQKMEGMTQSLANQFMNYFILHGEFKNLIHFKNRWGQNFDLDTNYQSAYIEALIGTQQDEEARKYLEKYLNTHADSVTISFAIQQYLNLRDTAQSLAYLSQLYSLDTSHPFIYTFGQLLFSLELFDSAFNVIENHRSSVTLSETKTLNIADKYLYINRLNKAIEVLKPHVSSDTSAYLLANIYQRKAQYDSAVYYLNWVFRKDSSNLIPLFRKGKLYEDRGWLTYASNIYSNILISDSNFYQARERIDIVKRKIAYLQQKKREEEKASQNEESQL